MIKTYKLEEIAVVEGAKKDKIYPKGSILFEKSATKGVVEYLEESGELDSRYAVAVITEDFNTRYIYEYINYTYLKWFSKNRQGINLPWETLKKFPLKIETDRRKQDEAADAIEKTDFLIMQDERTINVLEEVKRTLLKEMFV